MPKIKHKSLETAEKCKKGNRKNKARTGSGNAARERSRVRTLRNAYTELQKTLPSIPPDTKLSKLDILILATTYISQLTCCLNKKETNDSCGYFSSDPPHTEQQDFQKNYERKTSVKNSLQMRWPMRSRLYKSFRGESKLKMNQLAHNQPPRADGRHWGAHHFNHCYGKRKRFKAAKAFPRLDTDDQRFVGTRIAGISKLGSLESENFSATQQIGSHYHQTSYNQAWVTMTAQDKNYSTDQLHGGSQQSRFCDDLMFEDEHQRVRYRSTNQITVCGNIQDL